MIAFFTKDWDHRWRQIRLPVPDRRGELVQFELPIAGDAATQQWQSWGHRQPWHQLTPKQVREFGISIENDTGVNTAFSGAVYLSGVWLCDPGDPETETPVRNIAAYPHAPKVGERYELSFQLRVPFSDPFDPDSVDITGTVQTPAGKSEPVRGFYFEDFLYDRFFNEHWRQLKPCGHPLFKIRYTPRVPGDHTLTVTARVGDERYELPVMSFSARPAGDAYNGFVRVDDEDKRLLVYDNGREFWGIGLNVRSPYDTRYKENVPYTNWNDEGLKLYERLLPKLAENGINVVEVWMSSWWLALEWINDAPGFHGVGHMNQYRAWMMDRIVQWAEQNGIYLIVVFNNHGKFGELNDTEWARNPYNTKNGGFLDGSEEYFSDERAKAAFRRFADYALARWSYSPNILMWKLFSEIDLTGDDYNFYKQPVMADWHREMGQYVKNIDLYDHPVTTHWMLSYKRINKAVGGLPQLDVLTTDAYYNSTGGTRELLKLLRGTADYAESMDKPVIVTEYGGSPHADSMGNLIKQARIGIWTGFFEGMAATPFFWWFALVDDKNLYGMYKALGHFTAGESRAGKRTRTRRLVGDAVVVKELRGKNGRILLWGFDADYYFSSAENQDPIMHRNIELSVSGMPTGTYAIEYWNCETGLVVNTKRQNATSGQLNLHVPAFSKDFAVKIKPVEGVR